LKSKIDVIAIDSRIILVAHHGNRGSTHRSRPEDVNYVGRGGTNPVWRNHASGVRVLDEKRRSAVRSPEIMANKGETV
jgi:hypothetical protein